VIARQFLRQYAHAAGVDDDVAVQEVVLTYVLQRIGELALWRRLAFKGGTSLRKTVFGNTGRFSRDIDLLALDADAPKPEDELLDGLGREPFYGLAFEVIDYRYSREGNFGGIVRYRHDYGEGTLDIQISHRRDLVLPARPVELISQTYFPRLEFAPASVNNLRPMEMLAEKVLACARRLGGSGRDVYDLYQYAQRPIDFETLRRVVCAKAWTDGVVFEPDEFLRSVDPRRFNWGELRGLLGPGQAVEQAAACRAIQERYGPLRDLTELELRALADATAHRDRRAYQELVEETRRLDKAR
jgi:predicted nucleotidyltransferase component of viral defense system